MTKNVLQSIVGADVFAIFSLLLFVAVFVLMLFFVMRSSKQYINRMAALPLEDDEILTNALTTDNTK
ncbi:MAG: CcoQ/FixQ family Cbb3-type cytochrome c oxidase assembly chaperone [Candidatus Kapabacteria bacterium]|nr:CcoQ/FixQ family Cbb3-type cytochrome c oxidase assembly chaperone [Candidatus Kapabacteria bacterium]